MKVSYSKFLNAIVPTKELELVGLITLCNSKNIELASRSAGLINAFCNPLTLK